MLRITRVTWSSLDALIDSSARSASSVARRPRRAAPSAGFPQLLPAGRSRRPRDAVRARNNPTVVGVCIGMSKPTGSISEVHRDPAYRMEGVQGHSVYPGGMTTTVFRHVASGVLWGKVTLMDDYSSVESGDWHEVVREEQVVVKYRKADGCKGSDRARVSLL